MPIREPSRPQQLHLLLPPPLLSFLLLWTMLITLVAADCPSLCECKWKNGKESVRCHNANLTEIPQRLDAGTQVLDLQRNEIIRLDGDEFSAVNLLNLQKIYLIDCQVTHLHRYAFRNLINLVELDLSENRLSAVPSHVFDSMGELRELRLSGNPVLRLENLAFNGLAHLVRLELSNCRIRRIEVRAFDGVRLSLEWLKLDGNELINVQPAALTVLNNLHGIELTRNNWNCTCALRPLREWMLQQNIPYEFSPVCAYPERLKDRAWSRMDVDEFACPPLLVARSASNGGTNKKPQHLTTVTAASGGGGGGAATTTTTTTSTITVKAIEGQNVTIGCGIVTGNPDPTIRWMFRNRVIVGNVSLRTTSAATSTSSFASSSSSSSSSTLQSSTSTASQQQQQQPEGNSNGGRSGSSSSSSSNVAAMTTLDTRKKFYHHLSASSTNVTIAWIDSHDSGLYKCIGENGAGRSEATISVLVYSRHYLIDGNNNVIEASVALAHSNNRFIFIISTIVAILFVIFSLLLAVCYYTVHKKNTRATAAAAMMAAMAHSHHGGGAGGVIGGGCGGEQLQASNYHQQQQHHHHHHRKKVLNKKSFSFLLCQNRSESYEKIEMMATANPMTTNCGTGGGGGGVAAHDETRIYCEKDEREQQQDHGENDMRSFPKLSPESKSVQDKRRRTMSLNLSNSPARTSQQQQQQQRKKAALSCRRNGDYSNVPTTADEDSSAAAGSGHDKLMVTRGAAAMGSGPASTGSGMEWKLFTKHQAQSDREEMDGDGDRQSSQWLNGPSRSYLPHGELGITSSGPGATAAVHQKVTGSSAAAPSLRSNINLSTISGNFSHPLADLSSAAAAAAAASSTEPLINIDTETNNLDLIQPSEVIRHHVMRKRVLTAPQQATGTGELNKSEGIVIYTTTTKSDAQPPPPPLTPSPESLTTDPPLSTAIIGGHETDRFRDPFGLGGVADANADEEEEQEEADKLGRLSPTLNSIIRNDENFDLFDVRSNLDDFYVKQLNYDYHQLQAQQHELQRQQQQLMLMSTSGGGRMASGNSGKQIPNQNYFCSLPRKRSYESSKKNLMGFSMADSCGEDLFDAPLEDSLFRQQQQPRQSHNHQPQSFLLQPKHRQKSSSELNLMTSLDSSTANDLSFISHANSHSRPFGLLDCDDDEYYGADRGDDNGRQGTIIKPLGDNNKATPLLNFPTTSQSAMSSSMVMGGGGGGATKVTATGSIGMALGMGSGGGGGGSGIFPSNCASPSIMMGSSGVVSGPLASSILSPTNVSGASSSSPSSSSVSSSLAAKKSSTGTSGNGSSKGSGGDYDYHAAQLEMFLDEYKRLQLQLCKMKETCDNIRRTEMIYGNYSATGGGGGGDGRGAGSQLTGRRSSGNKLGMSSSISSINDPLTGSGGGGGGAAGLAAYDPYHPMNNKLLEKSNILLGNETPGMGGIGGKVSSMTTSTLPKSLAFGNKHKSYSGTTPEPPPYWLHRNELLKGIQQQQQQNSQYQFGVGGGGGGIGTNHRKTTTGSSTSNNPENGTGNSSTSSSS